MKTEHMELDSRCSEESRNGQTGKESIKKERRLGGGVEGKRETKEYKKRYAITMSQPPPLNAGSLYYRDTGIQPRACHKMSQKLLKATLSNIL